MDPANLAAQDKIQLVEALAQLDPRERPVRLDHKEPQEMLEPLLKARPEHLVMLDLLVRNKKRMFMRNM